MSESSPAAVTDWSNELSFYATGRMMSEWAGTTSDAMVFRAKDRLAGAATLATRTQPYGRAIQRALVDNVIGADMRIAVSLDGDALGITPEEGVDLAEAIENEWFIYAEKSFAADAQRRQTFTGLIRTAVATYVATGEILGSVEWKPDLIGYATCLKLIDPTRLSDPNGSIDPITHRRMGVERDEHGEPIGYHIRKRMPSDSLWNPTEAYTWDYFERYTDWGRPRILHMFEADMPDMTRGWSPIAMVVDPVKHITELLSNERDAAALRSEYAGVITADIDYEKAMTVVGADSIKEVKQNGFGQWNLNWMKERAPFYQAQRVSFGKAKIVHLLPNEKMELLHSTQAVGSLKEMHDTHLYEVAAGAGVDWATLTRNYNNTSYSGGRYSTAENSRSYDVRRDDILTQFVIPFAYAWLEEAVVVRGTIQLPGNLNYYEARRHITLEFTTYGKVLLDPSKETDALIAQYRTGAISLRDYCHALNRDYRDVIRQRAAEKALMERYGLKPEDIDWTLIAPIGTAEAAKIKATQPPAPSSAENVPNK